MAAIAVVGLACRYPDARTPAELWENVLAGRQAFRRLPPERLSLDDYFSPDRTAADRTYATEAALLEGYEFDRVRFRVSGRAYRAADLAHWLALDVAAEALADAGFADGAGLPRDGTGVVLGNTLTGEFSRANVLRLRWPFVRRVAAAALAERGWSPEEQARFLDELEQRYKAPFPEVTEETLAGSLSNTIAGRVCNHFDLHGGGFTVDAACASSLLAVIQASSALEVGDLDVALAGGVDLSLDPFELVGFAKTEALAAEAMRVYDRRSAGFWPGEGCGVVVLMRLADAEAQGRKVRAVLRGWGVSSDGGGGITRPEVEGQLLALRRAYRKAGFGADTVAYFEGHGTGTAVGDAAELAALARARGEGSGDTLAAVVGSVKAILGHTKAAAGAAGLIKAVQALGARLLPPTAGCTEPHAELTKPGAALRVLAAGEEWPAGRPLRAGVSAMGFGGINTHVVLEAAAGREGPPVRSERERAMLRTAQDVEVFFLAGTDAGDLRRQAARLAGRAGGLSRAELTDLAAMLAGSAGAGPARAAVVAGRPAELAAGLQTLDGWLGEGRTEQLDVEAGVFLGAGERAARVGFLFPGQGSPVHADGGAWVRRFEAANEVYARAALAGGGDPADTARAQPAIVAASLAGVRVLESLGLAADVAVGHSLGELTALAWGGALDEAAVLRIAAARGRILANVDGPAGAMAGIEAGPDAVAGLLNGEAVVLAGLNSPRQTVVSGEASAVAQVAARARERGLRATVLPVARAFHSPLVEEAAPRLAEYLLGEPLGTLGRRVVSTVTGGPLDAGSDLREVLRRQIISPVRFIEAVAAAGEVGLWIEVGPGRVLQGLARDLTAAPVAALDAGGRSLRGLCCAVGAAFALGRLPHPERLFADRFTRPFDLDRPPRFLASPCEMVPATDLPRTGLEPLRRAEGVGRNGHHAPAPVAVGEAADALAVVRGLVAERAELPAEAVGDDDRLLSQLHLSSITVGQLVAEAARRIGLPPPAAATEFADASVAEVARALEELARTGASAAPPETERFPAGVDAWIRCFRVELVERPLPRRAPPAGVGTWRILAAPDHPLAAALEQVMADAPGGGVVVCLASEAEEPDCARLLEGTRAVLDAGGPARFVLVPHGRGGAALARTLHLEAPQVSVCVVEVPHEHSQAAAWVRAEALAALGYAEAHYDAEGRRRELVLRLLPPLSDAAVTLGPEDVLLVSGGGKGIAAECALDLARRTGAALALLGRARPEEDAALAANLERLAAAGVRCGYWPADVTDGAAVAEAVRAAEKRLGPVTAVLHGAGVNVPRLLRTLDEAALRETFGPKVQGFRNLLAAVEPGRLKMLVTFGSIIARVGLAGEADYALANEWLTSLTEEFAAAQPACRCLAVEWSVWSGVGMGERLGRIDALARQGITAIGVDVGVALMNRLAGGASGAVVVTGRFGSPPTLAVEAPELPFQRFLEAPRVCVRGVELVVDCRLSVASDPYVEEHKIGGERLLPAVVGLEAMAQVARALAETEQAPVFEEVSFARPVVVPESGSATVRLAALVRRPGVVEVVLRAEATGFQADHFRALCRFGPPEEAGPAPAVDLEAGEELLPLDPAAALYGDLLFHEGRYRRLRGYRRLRARECVAEIRPGDGGAWFGPYQAPGLVLGDPAARDTVIHALQACIPHATVLPVGVDRLAAVSLPAAEGLTVWARQTGQAGDTFTFDVVVRGGNGEVVEWWQGLRLRRVRGGGGRRAWAVPLLGPLVERRLGELVPGSEVSILVEAAGGRGGAAAVLGRLLGGRAPIHRRPDGKPEATARADVAVSAAHAAGLTLAVAGQGPLGCDLEAVAARPAAVWRDLLGADGLALAEMLVREAGDDADAVATRVWAAKECLKKAGAAPTTPLVLEASAGDGWVVLAAGPARVGCLVTEVREVPGRLALAVLTGGRHAEL